MVLSIKVFVVSRMIFVKPNQWKSLIRPLLVMLHQNSRGVQSLGVASRELASAPAWSETKIHPAKLSGSMGDQCDLLLKNLSVDPGIL